MPGTTFGHLLRTKVLMYFIALFIRALNTFQMFSTSAHFHISLVLRNFFTLNLKAIAIVMCPVHNFRIKIQFHDKRKRFVDNQKRWYTHPPLTLTFSPFPGWRTGPLARSSGRTSPQYLKGDLENAWEGKEKWWLPQDCMDVLIKLIGQAMAYVNTTLTIIKARFQRKPKDNCPLVTQAEHKWLLQKFNFLTRFLIQITTTNSTTRTLKTS